MKGVTSKTNWELTQGHYPCSKEDKHRNNQGYVGIYPMDYKSGQGPNSKIQVVFMYRGKISNARDKN